MNRSGGIVTRFDSKSFSKKESFTHMGTGSFGAKARGLAGIKAILETKIAPLFKPVIQVDIPFLTVITSDFFDLFMEENHLIQVACSSLPDDKIALAFQRAELPAQLVNDLRVFIAQVRVPLAIRSSSLLEDAMREPFAGVYDTKMIPNNQPDPEDRLRKLMGAIKYVYASTFFKRAKDYLGATRHSCRDEKMAVIVQEVVGACHNNRFYPHASGVARSFNFYPLGLSLPENGVVDLALGFGKIIVDEGVSWSFSPAYPHANPPYNTLSDLLKLSQKDFWAIDMREPTECRPPDEIEHLKKYTLAEAEQDGTLTFVASTFKAEEEKIVRGIAGPGPRVLDFAHILKADLVPLTALLKESLRICGEFLGTMVEIEFAMTFPYPEGLPTRFGFLQVRPMAAAHSQVEVRAGELIEDNVLLASESALGNGTIASIRDVVYVKPQAFETWHTQSIGQELEGINRSLISAECPYVLIGFGRWGSSDPSAGIPINFGQISGAKVVVEATLPKINFTPSQGSHFFHNITSFRVLYFSVGYTGKFKIDWEWLNRQQAVTETEFVRHVRLSLPLLIKVDGRTSRGVILR